MRILVLNANTTDFVTQTAANEARRVASLVTEIVPATADMSRSWTVIPVVVEFP